MIGNRKRVRRARAAVSLTQTEMSKAAGSSMFLPPTEVQVMESITRDLGDRLMDASPSAYGMGDEARDVADAVDEAYGLVLRERPNLGDGWYGLMTRMTKMSMVFYVAKMGRADLAESFAKLIAQSIPADDPAPVEPAKEGALVGVGIYSPEFRSQAPELAQMVDEAIAEDGSIPFDLDVVKHIGISEREPSVLTSTRPYMEQSLSGRDVDAIGGIALLIASGAVPDQIVETLTFMELEVMQAAASRIRNAPREFTPEQVEGVPRLREAIEREMSRRPD